MIVCSVTPPSFISIDGISTSYGSIEDRVVVVQKLNAALRKASEDNGITFLDIYKYFCDPCGTMTRPFSYDGVHIRREFSDIVEYELESIL